MAEISRAEVIALSVTFHVLPCMIVHTPVKGEHLNFVVENLISRLALNTVHRQEQSKGLLERKSSDLMMHLMLLVVTALVVSGVVLQQVSSVLKNLLPVLNQVLSGMVLYLVTITYSLHKQKVL